MKTTKILIQISVIINLSLFILTSYGLATTIIIDLSGEVQLKRSQWKSFKRAEIGKPLYSNDELKLGLGASAKIECNNTEPWKISESGVYKVSDGCYFPKEDNLVSAPRPNLLRSDKETIPYIIRPRNTVLLSDRPYLKWNSIPDANKYTIEISELDWKAETIDNEIKYSGNLSLIHGKYYRLIVKTDTGVSSKEEQGVNLYFRLIDKKKAAFVKKETAKLKQQKLDKHLEALVLAGIYQGYDLKAEAIELLEQSVKEGNKITAAYQLLGNLYLSIDLSKQAKENYSKALELAKGSEDLEGQAEAQAGLGKSDYALFNDDNAIEWLKNAKKGYTDLGDKKKVHEIDELIKFISQ